MTVRIHKPIYGVDIKYAVKQGKFWVDGKAMRTEIMTPERQNDNSRNPDIIMFLCKNGAFMESEAMALFTRSHKGIDFICTKHYAEKIRTYINVARVLVFQESVAKRFERAKLKFETENGLLMEENYQEETRLKFLEIWRMNEIDLREFLESTYKHFMRQNATFGSGT